VRDRRLSNREASAQPSAPNFGLRSDMFENLDSTRIGKCLGYPLKLLSIHELPTPEVGMIDR